MNEHEVQVQEETSSPLPILLGTLALESPEAVVSRGAEIARALADVITTRKLYVTIQQRKYVLVEGWETLMGMLGVVPVEESVTERQTEQGEEFEARVALYRVTDGARIGGASAICGRDEKTWANRPRYAIRSMAATRATGKAARLSFSWIIKLAGYEPTPAEEMMGLSRNGEVKPSAPNRTPTPKRIVPEEGRTPDISEQEWDAVRDGWHDQGVITDRQRARLFAIAAANGWTGREVTDEIEGNLHVKPQEIPWGRPYDTVVSLFESHTPEREEE